jgi:membrane-associated phospholipid phosphatase
MLVGAARMYVGRDWPSEVVASTLLGALWVLLFAVAWRTRDRVQADIPGPGEHKDSVTPTLADSTNGR